MTNIRVSVAPDQNIAPSRPSCNDRDNQRQVASLPHLGVHMTNTPPFAPRSHYQPVCFTGYNTHHHVGRPLTSALCPPVQITKSVMSLSFRAFVTITSVLVSPSRNGRYRYRHLFMQASLSVRTRVSSARVFKRVDKHGSHARRVPIHFFILCNVTTSLQDIQRRMKFERSAQSYYNQTGMHCNRRHQ